MTVTAPAAWAGAVAVIVVALVTTTFVAFVPPNVTVVAPVRFVPVIVTLVPPSVVPELGLTLVTVGVAANTIPPGAVVNTRLARSSAITRRMRVRKNLTPVPSPSRMPSGWVRGGWGVRLTENTYAFPSFTALAACASG